jgi:hypothetical protein
MNATQQNAAEAANSAFNADRPAAPAPLIAPPGEEFTNCCLDSILNRLSNELRNDFPAARPRSKQRNSCFESWYSSIVAYQATKRCLAEKLLHTGLFDTYLETLLKTLLEFGEFPPCCPGGGTSSGSNWGCPARPTTRGYTPGSSTSCCYAGRRSRGCPGKSRYNKVEGLQLCEFIP